MEVSLVRSVTMSDQANESVCVLVRILPHHNCARRARGCRRPKESAAEKELHIGIDTTIFDGPL